MERLKQKVAASRVFASLQQATQAQQQASEQAGTQVQAQAQAPFDHQTTGEQQPPPPIAQVVPEAAMSTAWLMAADATAHLTDEERGILLEVFKKEEQFQRDTIKQLTASRVQMEQQQQAAAAARDQLEQRRGSSRRLLGKYRAASNQSLVATTTASSCTPTPSSSTSTTTNNPNGSSSRACSCSNAPAATSSATPSSSLSCSLHATPTPSDSLQRASSRQSRLSGGGGGGQNNFNNDSSSMASATPQPQNFGQCRICRKTIASSEPCHLCSNCQQFICDDCASYSSSDQHWMCSSCRRRTMNPAIPAEALKELGLNSNSSAVRRMTLRLNQNELKLALDRKNSAAALILSQQQQQATDSATSSSSNSAASSAASGGAPFVQRSGVSTRSGGGGGAVIPPSTTPTRSTRAGPQSQRSLERVAQEGKAAGRMSSSPAIRQPQQQATGTAATAGKTPRPAQQSQSASGRMANAPPQAGLGNSTAGRRATNAIGGNQQQATVSSANSPQNRGGGAAASGRRSYCELRASKLSAQKTMSQPMAQAATSGGGAGGSQAYTSSTRTQSASGGAGQAPPALASQQQRQTQAHVMQQQQATQWNGPEVKRAAPGAQMRDYNSEMLEQRRTSTAAMISRQASGGGGGASYGTQAYYEGGNQNQFDSEQQLANAPLPYDMSNFVSSSPLSSRRNSRQQLNLGGQLNQLQAHAQVQQYHSGGHNEPPASQRYQLAPNGEQVHMRRLSDQSNLFRRSSIVDDNSLEGLQMARNRSHSNIDSVHQVSSYLNQTTAASHNNNRRPSASNDANNYAQFQQQNQLQLAYQQRQSDQQLHSSCLAQETPGHFRSQQPQRPMGLLALSRDQEHAVSTSNVLYLPQGAQLAAQQRRLSDSGQYLTGGGGATFQQQQLSSIITAYAQKRPAAAAAAQQQQNMAAASSTGALLTGNPQARHHRRQSSEDFDQADDSSSSSSLDDLQQAAAYNFQQQQQATYNNGAITIPSVSVSEFSQAARRQSIQAAQQQQRQQQQQDELLFAQDNQITPMQINVAIEQVIQQQQMRDQQLLLAGNVTSSELERQLLLSARRGSSGRVLPRIPGDPQQSRSLLDLPLGGGGGTSSGSDHTSGSHSNPTRNAHALQNGTQATRGGGGGQLDLPLLSPGIRRASAPEGQNIKIVVDDIEPVACNGPGGHFNLRNPSTGGAGGDHQNHHQTFINQQSSAASNAIGNSLTKHYYPRDYYERHILCRDDSLDPNGLHVGRGFGLQVMGGKLNAAANKLEALITWVLPNAPADKVGLREGDKIIEWDGKCLVGMSYEQVAEVIESSANVAELLVKPAPQRLLVDATGGAGGGGGGNLGGGPLGAPTNFLRSQRRLSQQTERDLRRAAGATTNGGGAINFSSNQNEQGNKLPTGRVGTGRKLPQIPGGGGKLSATNSNDSTGAHYQALEQPAYLANVRHASTGQLDQSVLNANYLETISTNSTALGHQQLGGGGGGGRLLNNSASSQLNNSAFLSAFSSSQQQAAQQQSRSASELHRGSFSGPSASCYVQQQQQPQQQLQATNQRAYLATMNDNSNWPAQYGGSQQMMTGGDSQLNARHHQMAHFGSQLGGGALSPISGHSADELSGLIGLQVNVDERSATLEISILAAHNIERNPSLDYQVRVKILPESSRFKVCTTQPSNDMNWKETFLFHNFPTQNVQRMALEIGIWVHEEAPRLSAQIVQPICEALIPIQSARERNIDFWPLRPPPTSPQARRKSLNDLMGNHYAQQQQQMQQQQQQQQQHQAGHRDSGGGAALLSAGYKQTNVGGNHLGHQVPWLATGDSPQHFQQATPSKQKQHRQRTSPLGSSTRLYQMGGPNDSPTLIQYQQRERSASNRNLPDQSNKLHVQPRRASDEVATSSSGRLSARISPAASRRSISVMNVGGDQAGVFNPANAAGGGGSNRGSRLGSQASILKAAQMRRDSASQQQQQSYGINSSPVGKFSASCSPSGGSNSRVSETGTQQAIGCTPAGRRSSLVGIQSMTGYRSQKNSQSDATDHESPLGMSKRAREQAAAVVLASQVAQQQQQQQPMMPNANQDDKHQQAPLQQQRRPSASTMVAGQQQPIPQQQQQRQVVSGPNSTRPSSSSNNNSRRGSSSEQQQMHGGLQRRSSFAMQTLRKLKRTMSFNKNDNSLSGSNQDSRRSSDASNQSALDLSEDLAVTRAIRSSDNVVGRIKLSFIMTKGQFEVEVICASGLKLENQDTALGVYVKMYLRGKSKSNKRKTRVVQQQLEAPTFRQIIRYDGSLVDNKLLEVSVWVKQGTLRGKVPVGVTEIRLGDMNLVQQQTSWYNLRSMDTLCSSSVEE